MPRRWSCPRKVLFDAPLPIQTPGDIKCLTYPARCWVRESSIGAGIRRGEPAQLQVLELRAAVLQHSIHGLLGRSSEVAGEYRAPQ
jgi:hypothetical protein